jgi:hypothetical protein
LSPGCSPTKTIRARFDPSPKTVCVPVFQSEQALHLFAAAQSFPKSRVAGGCASFTVPFVFRSRPAGSANPVPTLIACKIHPFRRTTIIGQDHRVHQRQSAKKSRLKILMSLNGVSIRRLTEQRMHSVSEQLKTL